MTTADMFSPQTEVLPERDRLRDDLITMIHGRNDATPRHLQRELGPSEVAHPCMRRMAFGTMEVPRSNPQYDPLPSIVGTATHKWLETAAMHANNQLHEQGKPLRWSTETPVTVTQGLSGHCDLFDHYTDTVIDWKVLGDNSFKQCRAHMSPVYEMQVDFYGLGFENAGLTPKQVAVAILPRGGTLSRMHLWKKPYNRENALRGLAKRDAVIALLNDFDVESNPERYQWIPIEPYQCLFCPWFRPEARSPIQCDGKQ